MLFMVIEHFKNPEEIGARFAAKGRMLPEGVIYQGSWIDAPRARCFQIMEAKDLDALQGWTARWADLMDFEIVPVLTSPEYWAGRTSSAASD